MLRPGASAPAVLHAPVLPLLFLLLLDTTCSSPHPGPHPTVRNATLAVRDVWFEGPPEASFRAAIFWVTFDEPMAVRRLHPRRPASYPHNNSTGNGTAEPIAASPVDPAGGGVAAAAAAAAAAVSSSSSSSSAELFGLTRLLCGRNIFESHPSAAQGVHPRDRGGSLLPGFLVPLRRFNATTAAGIVRGDSPSDEDGAYPLVQIPLAMDGAAPTTAEYGALLVLRGTVGDPMAPLVDVHHSLSEADVDVMRSCTLRFLPSQEQSYLPYGASSFRRLFLSLRVVDAVRGPGGSAVGVCSRVSRGLGLALSGYDVLVYRSTSCFGSEPPSTPLPHVQA